MVRDDLPVRAQVMTMQEAIDGGADAFFDEKYGEQVRTIRVEGYDSFELCGGTHCRASGQVGGFIIVSERSIGSGMRRIEAVTGLPRTRSTDSRFETLERAASGGRRPDRGRAAGPHRGAPGRASATSRSACGQVPRPAVGRDPASSRPLPASSAACPSWPWRHHSPRWRN